MKLMSPYLNLNGKTKEAMEFYQGIFGGNLEMMTYGQVPAEDLESMEENKSPEFHSYFGATEADRVPASTVAGKEGFFGKAKDLIYHGMLMSDKFCLMASDIGDSQDVYQRQVSIGLSLDNQAEFDKVWNALLAGKKHDKPRVMMTPYKPFWGEKYGIIVDQFGICWQIVFYQDK